jgi:hypothetical protein
MIGQILKTKCGKWALMLGIISVLSAIGSVNSGSTKALPGVLIMLAVAAVLVASAVKSIKNPPPAPTLEELGIHVTKEAIEAFKSYGTLPRVENSPVILNAGEQAVYACRADRIETKNHRIGTTGGGAGVSVKVAKGIRFRTGGTGSKSVYGDVEMIHSGEFVVTTHRIVFVANSRAFEEQISAISAVSVDEGCLAIMATGTSYALRMPMPEYPCDIIKHCIKSL